MGFTFHHGGRSWDYDSLTGVELTDLEKVLECRYIQIEPGVNAKHTLAILATFLSRDKSEDQVEKIIKRLTRKEILNDIWSYTVDDDMPTEFEDGLPKATAGTSGTGTSSSSRSRRTAGPRQSRGSSRSET